MNWTSPAPEKCYFCQKEIKDTFIDGKTHFGPWGIMCEQCHVGLGIGLGTGKGQKYQKENDKVVKVAG